MTRAGRGLSGRHVGRALHPLGTGARGADQRADDGAGTATAWTDAQKKTLIARERDEAARAAWREAMDGLDPSHLIFLDETGTPTILTPVR